MAPGSFPSAAAGKELKAEARSGGTASQPALQENPMPTLGCRAEPRPQRTKEKEWRAENTGLASRGPQPTVPRPALPSSANLLFSDLLEKPIPDPDVSHWPLSHP